VLAAVDHLLIDARKLQVGIPETPLIKGDARSLSIAAASILAKVERDREMTALAAFYPEYGFERHKGYATEDHLNAVRRLGVTPLHRAVVENEKGVAELLIEKGADVNAKNNSGWTPLHRVHTKDVAELLIAKGADVNAKNRVGWTPLHTAAKENRKDVVQALIAKGANVNATAQDGQTPLQLAIRNGKDKNKDVIDLLNAKGAH